MSWAPETDIDRTDIERTDIDRTDIDADTDLEGFAPWDGRRVPVTLIGGYLGAGKTTVINRLLARTDRPIAILVNDVGQIGVDHALISRRSSDAIELTDGCVCCSLRVGLGQAFDRIRSRPRPPDHVLIELSGVADPTQVTPWADSIGFRLDGVVVLADAVNLPDQLDDARVAPLVERQLAAADLVLVTKIDLVEADRAAAVADRVADLSSRAAILPASGPEAIAAILDTGTRRPDGVAAIPQPTLFDPHRVESVPLADPVSPDELHAILDELGPAVVRAKGVASGHDGSRLLVHVVGRRRSITTLPGAEDQTPTDLVVISLGE